ncbi:thermonuclease family protein [Pelagibacterium montanilacus]|uniref:thermonuclease family protein n=1 Tax=Pelagibacterium montanilacus TaxID=2185280 RepID=UPI000F8F17BC|nr:thermonuclease family protein [Pelagibacterium montanilacus]
MSRLASAGRAIFSIVIAGGRRTGRRARRPRPRLAEIVLGFVLVALIGYGAIGQGALDRTGLGLAPSRAPALSETVHIRFGPCTSRGGSCVIDGDTIRIDGVSVRIADIDTPEVRDYQCESEKALGDAATERMISLVSSGPFEMVREGSRDTDRYGRKLRVLERDGQSLGMILVDEGLARPWGGRREGWCG